MLNQFADDTDVFSVASESSIRQILEELDKFKWQSGFMMSYEKTTLYRIGSLRYTSAQMYDISEVTWTNCDINVLGIIVSHEDILHKNYDTIITKARHILNSWHNRGLSLMGKVQVVNTLIASLFVYKMMVLPQIPSLIVKQMENMIRNFLWDGRKAKIAFQILQNPKEHGGLNLVNLVNKDKALKATWPVILYTEIEYAKIVYGIMRCSGLQEGIWKASLKPEDVLILRVQEPFWEQVLMAWCEFNYYTNRRTDNQIIWYNSRIRIGGKPVMWNDIHQKGLVYVHQLFDKGSFKSYPQMKQEYGIGEMRYNGLRSAIPSEWKVFFSENSKGMYMPLAPSNYDQCVAGIIVNLSWEVYKFLSEDVTLIHNKYIKWTQDLGESLCEGLLDYGKLHSQIYKLTNVPKLRSFQYRLLQRGLTTNILLKKWGIVASENCYYCKKEPETVIHLLCQCDVVQKLWKEVSIFIRDQYQVKNVNITDRNIILNNIVSQKFSKCKDMLKEIRFRKVYPVCTSWNMFLCRTKINGRNVNKTVKKYHLQVVIS